MKIIAWSVVVIGWIAYGLVCIASFFNPHPKDPMDDFYDMIHRHYTRTDLILIPTLIVFIILWFTCWEYIKDKKGNKS